ncbi:MAG: CCA tRNA nucleotidyltransferase, partial [Candidatus Micrarchaeota archaeon]|nr:CCA tRNA nucleotidyltransferase [Candidatus Micrarchaeota archaeon]
MDEKQAAMSVFEKVIPKVKPTPEEADEEAEFARVLIEKIRRTLPAGIGVEMVGSMAKGTDTRGEKDFDIFLLFPNTYTIKDLEVMGLMYAKRAIKPHKWEIGYAEHPYLKAKVGKYDVEIVPSYKITDVKEMASAVDRSQLHSEYILRNMPQKMKDDVRLLKRFMRNHDVYGAELKTEGFSGYLCELLVLNYGGIHELLHEAAKWRKPVFIDVEKHYGGKEFGDKFVTPLVVIDPVDRNRNVAAVVSETSMYRFVHAAREFIRKPSEEFFFRKKEILTASEARRAVGRRSAKLVCLHFKAPDVVSDILWPQLRKARDSMVKQLELAGFKLMGADHWTDEDESCAIVLDFEVWELPKVVKLLGPDVHHEEGIGNFLKKHKNALSEPWIEGSKVAIMESRKHPAAIGL